MSFSLQENSVSIFYIIFENVPSKKLDLVKNQLFKSLNRFYEESNSFNMARLHSIIQKQKAETLTGLENQPHDSIAFMVIGDMLYGNTPDDVRLLKTYFLIIFLNEKFAYNVIIAIL